MEGFTCPPRAVSEHQRTPDKNKSWEGREKGSEEREGEWEEGRTHVRGRKEDVLTWVLSQGLDAGREIVRAE